MTLIPGPQRALSALKPGDPSQKGTPHSDLALVLWSLHGAALLTKLSVLFPAEMNWKWVF